MSESTEFSNHHRKKVFAKSFKCLMKHVNSFPTRRTLQPPTASSDGENTFINTRPESIKYYRERNVQCCRACSRGMHQGLFALNPFPSFFVSHLLLKPEKKRSDIQWSGNFFSIHYSFITHTTHKVCELVCARYSEKVLSGRLCWKISEKSFFSEPFPRKTILSKRCDGKSKPTLKMYTTPAEQNHPNPAFVHLPDISRSALFRRCQATAF